MATVRSIGQVVSVVQFPEWLRPLINVMPA